MGRNDLSQEDLPKLDWSEPELALARVYDYVVAHAKDAEGWYTEKRRPKKQGGQLLRITSIVLLGIAALIPILSEVLVEEGEPVIPAAWASVALVVAATLVGLDRYFGFSTGWTRLMTTNLRISRLRREFEFRWNELEAAAETSGNEPLKRLQLAHKFVQAVDQAVAEETSAWSDEFRAALDDGVKELDRQKADAP